MAKIDGELNKIIKNINKKYGEGTITTGDKAVALKIKRIPSGSFTLDCETGGGYPQGRFTIIAGPYSGGKTFLALKAVSEAQKKYPTKDAVWIDQEGVFDADWASNFDIDLGRLHVVRPATAEHAWDITLAFMQSENVSIIVVDSLAAMTNITELEKSMEESQAMGGNAKMNNEFFRKGQGILNLGSLEQDRDQPAILIINQLRDSMDKYKPEVLPGGRGQEFFASMIIYVRIGDKYLEKRPDGKEVYVGHQIKFKVEKNKTFPPKRQGTFDIYVDDSELGFKAGDIDRLKEVVTYAIYWGVIGKAGSWFTILGNENWKFQGADKVINFLRDNPDIMQEVEQKVLAVALNTRKTSNEEIILETEDGKKIDQESGEILEEE